MKIIWAFFSLTVTFVLSGCGQDHCVMGFGPCRGISEWAEKNETKDKASTNSSSSFAIQLAGGKTELTATGKNRIKVVNGSGKVTLTADQGSTTRVSNTEFDYEVPSGKTSVQFKSEDEKNATTRAVFLVEENK